MFARVLVFLAATIALGAEPARSPASESLESAVELFKTKKYPDARAALAKIVAAEPGNAAANYYLGRTLELRGDADALGEAVTYLRKAAELEPNNSTYVGRYGGASLQLAERTSSFNTALRGRDAMERAIELNPDDLDAREGLMQFYLRAPWPLGNSTKAAAQLEAIRQRDSGRATVLSVLGRINARDFSGAFTICEEALARNPDDYNALYQYGRTAIISGENLARGLTSLKRCVTLEPPSPASPSHSQAWQQIGRLQEKLKNPAEARSAYEAAVRLDAGNREAADALKKLNLGSNR